MTFHYMAVYSIAEFTTVAILYYVSVVGGAGVVGGVMGGVKMAVDTVCRMMYFMGWMGCVLIGLLLRCGY